MSDQPETWQLYIDGEWTDADDELVSTNPTTGETVARVAKGDRADARTAIDAANAAEAEWAALSQHERGAYLRDAADALEAEFGDLVTLISEEMGKVGGWAAGELTRAIDLLNYYAEVARDEGGEAPPSAQENTRTFTAKEPWGTAGIVTPWNYPIAIPTWKLAPALVAGNTAVFKPASATPAVAAKLVEAFETAGLPDGVLNFVPGGGSEVGDEIVTGDGVDVVSFTGSYDVGHHVHEQAAESGKRVQCEMGGKNPIVVDETADLDHAVELTVGGAFSGLAGQACTATSRAVVFEEVYDEYLEKLTERVENIAVGDPTDRSTEMGPKVSESELESDLEYIELGKESDARLVTGGGQPAGEEYENGNFVEPTVFADVEPDARIAQEEIFGPVLAVIPVADFDEALDVANGVDYGLSASLATNRLDRSERFARESETGIVKINQESTGVELQMPFGGRKQSSSETFKEQGRKALEFYTHEKAVYVTHYDE